MAKSAIDMAASKRGMKRKSWGRTHFGAPQIEKICDSLRSMDAVGKALLDENAALRARARRRAREGVGRHGADRRAKASDRQARSARSTGRSRSARRGCSISWRSYSKSWKRARRRMRSPRNRPSPRRRRSPASTRKRPERNTFPEHLPRERVVIEAPTTCACCGGARLRKLGEDVTQTLETTPRQWKVIETVREKFTCRDCEKITQAPAPFHVVAARLGRAEPPGDDRCSRSSASISR